MLTYHSILFTQKTYAISSQFFVRSDRPDKTVRARLRRSVAKTLFLSDLGQFFTRNEDQSKAQSPSLICIITHHCDRYGHSDCGLRIADCGFRIASPPLPGSEVHASRPGCGDGRRAELRARIRHEMQNETWGILSRNRLFPMITVQYP